MTFVALDKPPVLLLGAGSLIAPHLARLLAEEGWSGVSLSRRPPAVPLDPAFPWRSFDMETPGNWSPPPGAILVSMAPLARLCPLLHRLDGCSRVLAFGTTSLFAKAASHDPEERELVQSLERAEGALARFGRETGIPWTVLRPTLIYDPWRDKNVSAVARVIRKFGFFPVAPPALGLRQPVHAEDLARTARAALFRPEARCGAFNVCGGETLPYGEMVTRIFQGLGRSPRILPVPLPLLRLGLALLNRLTRTGYSPELFTRMNQDLAFDDAPARALLGHDPRPFQPDFSL